MRKKITLLALGMSLLACNFLFSKVGLTPPDSVVPSATEPGTQSNAQEPASTEFTIIRLHPKDGDLKTMLAAEAQKASALRQMPIVEFDAVWCGPCQAIDKGLKTKNELMLKAYAGTYIIKLDVDEWGWGDSRLHDFEFSGIPVYFKLDAQGHQTGEVIDGNAWGDNIPENIAPPMDKFFHGN